MSRAVCRSRASLKAKNKETTVRGSAHGTRSLARGVVVAAIAAEYVPALATLGQWSAMEVLPRAWCRWRAPADQPRVAITFDDGPHPVATPAVLDRLDTLGLRATFFPLASLVERDPGMVAEIVRRGHVVGTHGFHHEHHLLRSPGWVRRDLAAAAAAMAKVGIQPRWYRPAYGQVTGATLLAARRAGLETVLWSAWGREWATADAASVARRISRRLEPGAIVLLHDNDAFGPKGMWRTALEALDLVAAELDRRGLGAATLDELVAARPDALI